MDKARFPPCDLLPLEGRGLCQALFSEENAHRAGDAYYIFCIIRPGGHLLQRRRQINETAKCALSLIPYPLSLIPKTSPANPLHYVLY